MDKKKLLALGVGAIVSMGLALSGCQGQSRDTSSDKNGQSQQNMMPGKNTQDDQQKSNDQTDQPYGDTSSSNTNTNNANAAATNNNNAAGPAAASANASSTVSDANANAANSATAASNNNSADTD